MRVGPADAPAGVVRMFTGGAARLLRQELPCLPMRDQVWWSPWFCAASVGFVAESTVHSYIEHPWNAVIVS